MAALLMSLGGLGGCTSMAIANGKFADDHPDCDESTTLRDADGTIHVLGCGTADRYHCTTTQTYGGEHLVPVYGSSATSGTLYSASGTLASSSSSGTLYQKTAFYIEHTTCDKEGAGEPSSSDQPWKHAPRSNDAPPVEVRTEQGRVTVRLELVLNHSGLLTLTSVPSTGAEQVGFRLARRELHREADGCALGFAINDQPFAMPAATAKRDDEMLTQQLRLDGERLARFDRIKRLTLTTCDRRWFLTRAQILRLREFMAQHRRELARVTPPVVVTPPPPPTAAPASAEPATPPASASAFPAAMPAP